MRKRTSKELNLFKILDLFGMLFVTIATINNFLDGVDHEPFTRSLLYPFTNFLVPGLNIFTLVSTIIYLFIPHHTWIIFWLFFIESVQMILTGFENVGIVMYINFFAVLCASGNARKHFKLKFAFFMVLLFLLLLPIIWTMDLFDFFYYVGFSCFLVGCFVILYFMLKDQLSFLFTDINVPDLVPQAILPEKGSILNLKSLGLTERQIACINYTLNSSYNYKKIAEILITSESTVKKDMQDLYKFFGVKNREMLRLLLVQYTIV